jgi:hypothetical protein
MESMITKTSTPLFEGFSTSMLSAILLLNLKVFHGVNNIFMDKLFSLLKIESAKRNKMPTTIYEAFKLIKGLGLSYDSIHICINGCVFSRHLERL